MYGEKLGGVGTSAPTRMSEVQDEITTFQANLNDFEATIEKLELRLQGILRISNPPPTSDEIMKQVERVPLAAEIRNCRCRLNAFRERLMGIVDRIEL